MPYNTIEKARERKRRYYLLHKKVLIQKAAKWNKEHPEARKKIYTKNNRKRVKEKRIWWESKSFGGKETIIGKTTCDRCGKQRDLVIHHKDGNRKNNTHSNLWVICRSCHAYIHGKERGGINYPA